MQEKLIPDERRVLALSAGYRLLGMFDSASTYKVAYSTFYRKPKRPKVEVLVGDATQRQPGDSTISFPSYSSLGPSVSTVSSTLDNCPASTSPTPIELSQHQGNENTNTGDQWYVMLPFGWFLTQVNYDVAVRGDSRERIHSCQRLSLHLRYHRRHHCHHPLFLHALQVLRGNS